MTTGPAKSRLLRMAERRGLHLGTDPEAFDPAFIDRFMPMFRSVYGPGRWFDVQVRGLDAVPDGPALLVSNHSGGTIVLDGFGLGTAWYTAHGPHRPLHGLAHEMVFATRTTGRFLERCGAIRADADTARRAFDLGRQVVVMPGGDQDVWRPASARYRVRFAGRRGYARLAMRLGVPIVPVAHVGAHHTLHVLTDGRGIARRLGIVRDLARAEVFPIHLSLPWGLAVGPWPHLPPPTRFDYAFGDAIDPVGNPDDPSDVAALDARVQRAIQDMLDALARDRRAHRPSAGDLVRRAYEGADSMRALAAALRSEFSGDVVRPAPAAAK